MKFEEAQKICNILLDPNGGGLATHFSKYVVCGSLRRKKEIVGDIDIVAIVKPEDQYQFGEPSLTNKITSLDPLGKDEADKMEKSGASRFLNGPLIKRFQYLNISIDLYLADESNIETLKLIRTGSVEHNIKLTQLARQKNLKLFASGKGLCEIDNVREDIIRVVEDTEGGILENLLGYIPHPQDR